MITQKEAHELFRYEHGKLYWRESPRPNIPAGSRAGSIAAPSLYRRISLMGKVYLEHRLVFLMFHGYIPIQIDHISDCLTKEGAKNNCIENLQPLTQSGNIQKSRGTIGVSRYRGVCPTRNRKRWQAYAYYKKRQYRLGIYDDEGSAAEAYDQFIAKYYNESCYLNFPKSR